ncbi:MAG: YbjN domain-containing protein [Caldilineaceae bacterium]|nr:YbjN domain-containing protein [Caldilineaceae bacterium]
MSDSDSIAVVFKQFCDESGFEFYSIGHSRFLALVAGQHGNWYTFCQIRDTIFYVSSVLPVVVPVKKRPDVLDYLNRINCRKIVGSFEMEPSGSEVRFRTSLDCATGTMTSYMIAVLFLRNVFTCDRYLPGLHQILFANMSPHQAFQDIEAAKDYEEPDAADLIALLSDMDPDQLPDSDDD